MCPGYLPELPTQDQIDRGGGRLLYRQRQADEHELIVFHDRLHPSEVHYAEVTTSSILGYIAALLHLATYFGPSKISLHHTRFRS